MLENSAPTFASLGTGNQTTSLIHRPSNRIAITALTRYDLLCLNFGNQLFIWTMRLINIKAFLEREEAMNEGRQVDRRRKVLEFRDNKTTAYAILSHRWVEDTEVDYEEMVILARMDVEERNEIRQRPGYWKIWGTCQQAKRAGYEWVWMDTCCIDK